MSGVHPAKNNVFDHLVYMRVFEGCNLHCQHCFIPSNPKKMSNHLLADIPNVVAKFAPEGSNILLQWHGGEPTLFGAKWLRDKIDAIELDTRFNWKHGIQTNLINYDESFTQLYKDKFASEVGVSWDPGTIRRMKKGDPSSSEKFHEKFFTNLKQLVNDGISPYMVITATRDFFEWAKNPYRLFDMLREHNVKYAHIERLTKTGNARDNWDEVGVDNKAYSEGMSRILRAYAHYRQVNEQPEFFISPFDGLMDSVINMDDHQGYGCWSGTCDTTFHTIDANGYKSGCSALTSEYDNSRIPDGASVIKFTSFTKEREERRAKAYCGTCDFRNICSSGCLASDMTDGSGECSGGQILFNTAKTLSTEYQL